MRQTRSDGGSGGLSAYGDAATYSKDVLWLQSSPWNQTWGRRRRDAEPQRAALGSEALIACVTPQWSSEVRSREDVRAPSKSRARTEKLGGSTGRLHLSFSPFPGTGLCLSA